MTEGERIIKLETQMDNVEKKVDIGFKENREEMSKLNNKMDKFIETSEMRFANKWVEKIIWAIMIAFATGLVGLFFYLLQTKL